MSRGLGTFGERTVAEYLASNGWQIITRNFNTRHGEVDIIGVDQSDLVFVEVKTWAHHTAESLEYGVDARKQERIGRAARRFLQQYRWNGPVRFDVVLLEVATMKIRHYRDAIDNLWEG